MREALAHAMRAAAKPPQKKPFALYLDNYFDETDLTTYTTPALNFGPADPSRYLIAAVFSRSGSARTISSATIGGVSAVGLGAQVSNGAFNQVRLLGAAVAAGNSGVVSVTWSGACVRQHVALMGVYNLSAPSTVTDSDSDVTTASGDLNVGGQDVTPGGLCIGWVAGQNDAPWVWTNLTRRFDLLGRSLAFDFIPAGAAALAINAHTDNPNVNGEILRTIAIR